MPDPALLPGSDAQYAYTSTFHWKPLVNGYSGYYPPTYLTRLAAMRDFPTSRGLDRLRADGVRYIVVHERAYTVEAHVRIAEALTRSGAIPLGRLYDGWANASMFELR
jgi:hypothetical protein